MKDNQKKLLVRIFAIFLAVLMVGGSAISLISMLASL